MLYAVSGLSTKIEMPCPLYLNLIPVGLQRPGIRLWAPPWDWIQHETANTNAGADAWMHYQWLLQGAPDQYGNPTQTSFHFCVDDACVRQFVPVGEVTWQGADGNGPGNHRCLSSELCVNRDGNKALARRNAEALCGGILKAQDRTRKSIGRHWDYNWGECCDGPCDVQCGNRHHCPDLMMREGYWPTFVANAAKIIEGGVIVPDPTKPTVYAPGVDSDLCTKWFGFATAGGRTFSFDPDGPISKVWLEHGLATGDWPALETVTFFQDSDKQAREYFRFRNGLVIFRTTGAEARVLTKEAA